MRKRVTVSALSWPMRWLRPIACTGCVEEDEGQGASGRRECRTGRLGGRRNDMAGVRRGERATPHLALKRRVERGLAQHDVGSRGEGDARAAGTVGAGGGAGSSSMSD